MYFRNRHSRNSHRHFNRASLRSRRRGSALILTLMTVVLITLLALSLFVTTRMERASSSMALGKARSEVLADLTADTAIARLKEATEAGMVDGKMWISEPGRIRVYDRSNLNSYSDFDLFSKMPIADSGVPDQNTVDLNRRGISGRYAITGNIPGTMKIGWVNLPADPGQAFSETNQIVGRIAYWVDDDSCKVNINTADGSKKEDMYRAYPLGVASESFGFGTPGEISLQALKDGSGNELSNSAAAAVSKYAWDFGFNSAAEIGRVPGVPDKFYSQNQFNITHYSKIPEVNFFGEPRMYLIAVNRLGDTTFSEGKIYCSMLGGYSNYTSQILAGTDAQMKTVSEPIDFVYPTCNQFSPILRQYPTTVTWGSNNGSFGTTGAAPPKDFLVRMGNAINGVKSDGVTKFQWPAFNGVMDGYSSKYSLRQIDSLVVQIADMTNSCVFLDQYRTHNLPTIAMSGIINTGTDPNKSKSVIGLSRELKINEIAMKVTVSKGTINGTNVSRAQIRTDIEYHFPEGYAGAPIHAPYNTAATDFHMNNTTGGSADMAGPNQADAPKGDIDNSKVPPAPVDSRKISWLKTWWQNSLLKMNDQSNTNSGIDLFGNPSTRKDPDVAAATAYHPYRLNTTTGEYMGSVDGGDRIWPALEIGGPNNGVVSGSVVLPRACNPGLYFCRPNRYKEQPYYPMKPGVTQLRISGGITMWSRTGTNTGGWNQWEVAPLDCLRGPFNNEDVSDVQSYLEQAVIPVNFTVSFPTGAGLEYFSVGVRDPLVNKFPGDWEQFVNPSTTEQTMRLNNQGNADTSLYIKGGTPVLDPLLTGFSTPAGQSHSPVYDYDGANPGFRPSNGGDPLSLWLPRIDIRYPKQSRFPSVGALNYIRTGIIPDDLNKDLKDQKGTPFRCLNFSSSTEPSQSVHSVKYPDWAMLDLFTVPYLPQRPYRSDLGEAPTPLRKLTFGGATEGKLNINNPRIPYPFDGNAANPSPPERTAPLEALFYGLKTAGGVATQAYSPVTGRPVYTTVNHVALRQAVQQYLSDPKKRFLLPGQLADVPMINADTYSGVNLEARSRNDLLRQVVGATTTQSNVYSIWVVAQTIKKNPKNTQPDIFEDGDTILGETRRRYIVERHMEYGKDGVPGNAGTTGANPATRGPGLDLLVGTGDDLISADYHPMMTYPLPYRWKIVAVDNNPL